MLNLIRDNVQSFGVKFIVGIVVVVMSFFGISAYQSQSSNAVVTVDGYEVKVQQFQRAYENAREDIRQRYGAQASSYLDMVNLEAQVIRQLTSNALLLKSARKNGLAVSDKELAHEIYTNPAFMTDQRFDPAKYEQTLGNLRTDKIAFEKDLKESLLTQKFLQFVKAGALVSRRSLREDYRRYESTMKIKVIELAPVLFADQVDLTDKDIQEYYDLHKSDFQQKSQFNLDYFVLSVNDVESAVNVREREISRYYENHATEEFTQKESFHARHILISAPQDEEPDAMEKAKRKAQSIYEQLETNPEQFESLAKQYSEDPGSASKGGDLGWVSKGSFVEEFETVVDRLEINQLSKPFRSSFGFHIVQLLERKPARLLPFEEVKSEIEDSIRTNKARRRLANQVDKLLQQSEQNDFDSLAQSIGKSVKTTGAFDDTTELEDIGYAYQLYQKVKDQPVGQKGKLQLAGDQKILIYEITEVKEPYVKPLDEVKEQVRYYAREDKKRRLAIDKMAEYEDAIDSLNDFNKIAEQLNVNPVTISFKFSDRQLEGLDVSEKFKAEVFKLEDGETAGIRDGEQSYLVYMLDKQKGELDEASQGTLVRLENMLLNQKAQIVLSGLINKLQENVEVKYNMQLLNAMNVNLES